jgi:hypothetical protein
MKAMELAVFQYAVIGISLAHKQSLDGVFLR